MNDSGTTPAGVRWISYPVPLRPNFIATLDLPRDLTKQEADRLAAFIATLAQPEPTP